MDIYCSHDKVVDIEKVVPNPKNPNQHSDKQIELLAKIIKVQGWRAPITVSNRSGFIVRGHGRLMAAQKLGLDQVPVDYQDYENEAEEWADLIADNKIAELSTLSADALKDLMSEVDLNLIDPALMGFTNDEFTKMFLEDTLLEEDNYEPELPEEPVTRPGDIWILGPHRVKCGDATKAKDVKSLIGRKKMSIVITDPPYNVDYESESGLKIKNDKMGDAKFHAFLFDAFTQMYQAAKLGAPIYIFHADSEGYNFRGVFIESGFRFSQCLIWVKSSLVLGFADYQWRHEPILYGWKAGAGHPFYGDRKNCTVIEEDKIDYRRLKKDELKDLVKDMIERNFHNSTVIYEDKPHCNEEHPTMKPIRLVGKLMCNSSQRGDKVADFFGGSGSTLIAAEQLGRSCYMMELDERYCDVIVNRYIRFKKADIDVHVERDGHILSWNEAKEGEENGKRKAKKTNRNT